MYPSLSTPILNIPEYPMDAAIFGVMRSSKHIQAARAAEILGDIIRVEFIHSYHGKRVGYICRNPIAHKNRPNLVKAGSIPCRSVVAGGQGGNCPPLASEIRKFSEIQKFLGNSLSVWLLAQTRCLSFHSVKTSFIHRRNESFNLGY